MATTRKLQNETLLFDPKQQNLPFTIGVIKPDTCLSSSVQKIITKIEEQGFLIKNIIQRELYKQEVLNLYYKHRNKPYFEDLLKYMLSGECCVFLLCHETENPITKWKKMLGPMDPEAAKKTDPTSLRAQYGTSIIKNELHGSDDQDEANKQRQIFEFRIPQRPPVYVETPYKVTLETVKKFLHPPNLEHTCINQRMDILAMYGPIVNWHSVQVCFCSACVKVVRAKLEEIKKINKAKTNAKTVSTRPLKLLKEKDIEEIRDDLCAKCIDHCSKYVHLPTGRESQHLLTDMQINQLAEEINKKQLLELLTIQKGSAAKIMIETLSIKQPEEIQYNMKFVEALIRDLETDYYQRYDFTELQNTILEDRRVRMVYWVSKLTQKPPERFPPITTLDNSLTREQLTNPKSPFFTLTRTKPLPLLMKMEQLKHVPLAYDQSIVDKKRLYDAELNLVTEKKLHRNMTKVSSVGAHWSENMGAKNAVNLLRDYNEGRHGDWDNYSGLKGNSIKQPTGGKNYDKEIN